MIAQGSGLEPRAMKARPGRPRGEKREIGRASPAPRVRQPASSAARRRPRPEAQRTASMATAREPRNGGSTSPVPDPAASRANRRGRRRRPEGLRASFRPGEKVWPLSSATRQSAHHAEGGAAGTAERISPALLGAEVEGGAAAGLPESCPVNLWRRCSGGSGALQAQREGAESVRARAGDSESRRGRWSSEGSWPVGRAAVSPSWKADQVRRIVRPRPRIEGRESPGRAPCQAKSRAEAGGDEELAWSWMRRRRGCRPSDGAARFRRRAAQSATSPAGTGCGAGDVPGGTGRWPACLAAVFAPCMLGFPRHCCCPFLRFCPNIFSALPVRDRGADPVWSAAIFRPQTLLAADPPREHRRQILGRVPELGRGRPTQGPPTKRGMAGAASETAANGIPSYLQC